MITLLPETLDEFIDRRAAEMMDEMKPIIDAAYAAVNAKSREAQKFAHRSFGQRRRAAKRRDVV